MTERPGYSFVGTEISLHSQNPVKILLEFNKIAGDTASIMRI